jgi:hypothetical protein
MRTATAIALISLGGIAFASDDFSGLWKLNPERSEIRALPMPAHPVLKLEQKGSVLVISAGPHEEGPFETWSYPLDQSEIKRTAGDSSFSTRTKWEGAALMVSTLVSGPQRYAVMERWRTSRDRRTLTIKRTIAKMTGEIESLLVYENPAAVLAQRPNAAGGAVVEEEFLVEAGAKILLSLVNSVNTKDAAPGQRIYLQTEYPVLVKRRVVIPKGSYVMGTVTEARRAGRVKGKPSLYLRFDSLTLPNGVTRDLRSRPGAMDQNIDREEGKITGEGGKGDDARTVGQTTAAGAAVGGLAGAAAGRAGTGAVIGAAAGAAGGLIGVLSSRGPELILPQGTTMEMVLDRDLRFKASEIQ